MRRGDADRAASPLSSVAAWWRFGAISALLGGGILAALLWLLQQPASAPVAPAPPLETVYLFDGVQGPQAVTQVAPPRPAVDGDFAAGSSSRLAILLTDPDSAWLGLVHGLKSIGVPFRVTRDYKEALRHRVVLVYPTVSGRVLSRDALVALARFSAQGGSLLAVNVVGGGLDEVFGFSGTAPARTRAQITLDAAHPAARGLDDARERVVRFSNPQLGAQAVGSLGYLATRTPPLARFEDGTAAITARDLGRGRAYAFGIDPGQLLLKGYNNREQGIARDYVNAFEPALDVLLRLIANIYRAGEPAAVLLHTVPQGKPLAVVISHDIDYSRSIVNARRYAEFEREAGIRATYFIQTKYMRDWNDGVFFNRRGVEGIAALRELGAEIASHSVAHSRMFNRFKMGDGAERYPDYRPFVQDQEHTINATILGELRVSRFLLERLLPQLHVTTFRPGHLENPYQLPEALEATGYRYSSSVTANNSLTHLPFRLTYGRETNAQSAVYEFPVTIEDEAKPPLEARLPQALALAAQLSRYGALMMVLIHPDVVEPKLGFERGLVAALRERAWFGALDDYGAFWAARDRVEVDVVVSGGQLEVHLQAPLPLRGLALLLPAGYWLAPQSQGRDVRQSGELLLIDVLEGRRSLRLIRADGVR